MARRKETPRQKMIGLMYLVLTAMLALNVSKEVLDGYSVVNESVLSTNENYARKRKNTFSNFEKEYALNQVEVGPFWNKAKEAMRLSDEMIGYITKLRNELISTTEHISLDSAANTSVQALKKKDNYTIPTNFLIGNSEDGSNGRANLLKKKIVDYRQKMINLVNPRYRDMIRFGLETDDEYHDANGQRQNWEVHNFYDIPLAADVPILNKLITEVNNAELEVANALLYESNAEDFKYDRIEAKVVPKSDYLFAGEQYEAEVIVAAYDTSHSPNPKVYLMRGLDSLPVSRKAQAMSVTRQNGRMDIKFIATSTGLQKYAGFVSVPTNSGNENTYHFSGEYFVAKPSLTVSAINMNVLYVGVGNPISISVSGIPAENIYPAISNGMLRQNKNKGGWTAFVPSGIEQARIDVSVKMNGKMKRMGSEIFRVKNLPDPVPYIGGRKEGFVNRNNLIAAGKIVPKMPDDFEFDYSFQVISFKMTMQRGFNVYTYESHSSSLTDEMAKQIKNTNRGQVIIFDDIIARGPDGENRTLTPLIVTIS